MPILSDTQDKVAQGFLVQAFRDLIDDYLDFCAERGENPDKPFTGWLMLLRSQPACGACGPRALT
jgi:predicted HicB family RNase H-like nuclease